MVKKNACIFISGYGSNLRSLIHNSRNHNFPINISLVICNNANAKGTDAVAHTYVGKPRTSIISIPENPEPYNSK